MVNAVEHPVLNGIFGEINLPVSTERVASLLVTAFESGSGYWCRNVEVSLPNEFTYEDFRPGGKFTSPDDYYHPVEIIPFVKGCSLKLEVDAVEETADETQIEILDHGKMLAGLKVMAQKYPKHFADFLNEDDDATTADVFLQCCLFGEIVFC